MTLRYVFIGGMFAALAITSIFLAFYYNFVIQPRYEKQINTFDQITKSHYILAGDEQTKSYLMEHEMVKIGRTIL